MEDTQSCLQHLALLGDSEEDSEMDLVESSRGKRRKVFRNRSRSLTQPSPTSLQVQIDDEDDSKTIIKMLKKISTNFNSFKKTVTSDIGCIKNDLKLVKEDIAEIRKEKELTPDAINDDVSMVTLTTKMEGIEAKIDKISSSLDERAEVDVNKPPPRFVKDKITTVSDLDDKIDKRRKAFYDQHQLNDRIQIHQEWLNKDPPIIPAAFLPKYIPKEPEKEYQIRKKQKINELQSKIEIWDVRAKEAEKKVKHFDDLILQEINSSEIDDEQKETEKKAWVDLAKLEEEKSINIWKKKRGDIIAQPERQKERKKIQTLENKLYSTVVKSNTQETDNSNTRPESTWQTVTYNRRKNNHNSHRYHQGWQTQNFYGRRPPNRYKRN